MSNKNKPANTDGAQDRPLLCIFRSAPSGARRFAFGLTAFVVGLAGAGAAHAVVTVDIASSDFDAIDGVYRKTVNMDPSVWTNFSENCPLVNAGSTCDAASQPPANPSNLLFSWGARGDSRNSTLRVNFDLPGGERVRLDTITFDTTPHAQPLGPNVTALNVPTPVPFTPSTGSGTMVAYERDVNIINVGAPDASIHDVTHQRMDIQATYGGNTRAVNNWYVAIDQGTDPSAENDFLVPGTPPGTTPSVPPSMAEKPFRQDYFFTTTNSAGSGTKDTSVVFQDNDFLEFTFYESDWNNGSLLPELGAPPDAYYGTFDLIITPLNTTPSLGVTPDPGIDFGTVRAGDTGQELSLTAANVGDNDSTLEGVTFDALGGANPDAFVAGPAPTDVDLQKSGGISDVAVRSYSPGALGQDDTSPQTVSATQRVTSDNGTVDEVSRPLTAEIKGPILGLSESLGADPANPAEWLPYDSVIDLGSVDVTDPDLIAELALANIFSAADAVDPTITLLTFFNIGFDSESAGGAWGVVDNPVAGTDPDELQAQDTAPRPLQIEFVASDLSARDWTADLVFTTDQNAPYDSLSDANEFRFTLRVENAGAAPVPGVIALLGLGLVILARTRARERAAQSLG